MIKKILLIFGIFVLAVAGSCAGYVLYCIKDAPEIDTSHIYSMLDQKSFVYDEDGKTLDSISLYDGNRTIVDYDEMPADLINAIVSIEDKTFWEHHGFNFIRMIGAVKNRVFSGGQISGTSTITQQLARNIYLADTKSERTMKRKITEAYYTVKLERALSKKQIIESYLNTVYFGFGAYGVETASKSYFGKSVSKLSLPECVALAAIPQMPDTYALVYPDYGGNSDLPLIKRVDDIRYVYNGGVSEKRRAQVVSNMVEYGYLTEERKQEVLSFDLKEDIKLKQSQVSASRAMYFIDYAIEQVKEDLMTEMGVGEEEAASYLYTGGLNIYTTLDMKKQKILSEEFADDSNYTSLSYYPTDENGNILSRNGNILLYEQDSYFNGKKNFVFTDDEAELKDGNLIVYEGHRLNISDNGELHFKPMYTNESGGLCIMQDGKAAIPSDYVSADKEGNCIINGKLFEDYPDIIKEKDGHYRISRTYCDFGAKNRQPQAAAALIENSSGEVKAMIGGRGSASGRNLYNRATEPHQPGSSIKPVGVYGPALQKSFELASEEETMKLDFSKGDKWGKYVTAGSVINDAPIYLNGRAWPKNAYGGYRGLMTLRKAVQQSVNVCAVKVFNQIGVDYSLSMLKKNGITTIVEDGSTNDINAAALALGGMTNGVTPLELAAAYETFPNGGTYKEPIVYTKVVDNNGVVVLEKDQKTKRIYDEGVAWIMTDILRTVVTQGIATNAAIYSQPVGGKTGTTSDQYDIWFSGFTPQYTMALWEGNDVHIQLSTMSEAAASFWSHIMRRMCEGKEYKNFRSKPDNVIYYNGEYYVKGTAYSTGVSLSSSKDSDKSKSESKKSSSSSGSSSSKKSETKKPTEHHEKPTTMDPWFKDFLEE